MKAVCNPTKRYDTGRVLRSPCMHKVFNWRHCIPQETDTILDMCRETLACTRPETSLLPVTVGPSIHASEMINHGYD